jgi:hypothetical protein
MRYRWSHPIIEDVKLMPYIPEFGPKQKLAPHCSQYIQYGLSILEIRKQHAYVPTDTAFTSGQVRWGR